MRLIAGCAVAFLLASGCAAPQRGAFVPEASYDRVEVPGFHGIRTWGDHLDDAFMAELMDGARREVASWKASGGTGELPQAEYLAISGGGANGAYGAGLLNGWTAAGNRPEFKVVTGISTGALTSPFAFLGPAYDSVLREFYTNIRTKDVLITHNVLSGILGESLADSTPLLELLRRTVTESVMQAIAAEREKGRILLVGTTDLDAGRGVVWNLTAIAASGHPGALDLIHHVLLASASIPGVFPPVMIDVEVDGVRHEEMHTDGGSCTQVFLYPPSFRLTDEALKVDRARRLWIIRNARLDPEPKQIERSSLAVGARAVDVLLFNQGLGDLYRIYWTTSRDHIGFNLSYIPKDFDVKSCETFDRSYMRKLFDVGYGRAIGGTAWVKDPPGVPPGETETPESRKN